MTLTATMDAPAQTVTRPEVTAEHAASFRENGFLALPDALTPDEVQALRDETVHICRGEMGEVNGLPPVGPDDSDDEVIQRTLCVHFPHKLSQLMFDTLAHPSICDVLTRVIGPNVKSMQSMLFIKSAGKPGQAWHQDEAFIPTRDRSLNAAWIALDDANVENGCLWVIPGSHANGLIWPAKEHDDERFDCVVEAYDFPYTDDDAVPVEVTAGSIVFFNGYLLHRSLPNRAASGFRRALVNHYMSAESLLPWRYPGNAELGVASFDFRDIVMIAGRDPYAWKGTEDVSFSHIRPDREGGCQWPTNKEED